MIDGCGFNVDQDVTAWRLSRRGDIPDFKLAIACSANRLHCFLLVFCVSAWSEPLSFPATRKMWFSRR
jgi:hypothetical protein